MNDWPASARYLLVLGVIGAIGLIGFAGFVGTRLYDFYTFTYTDWPNAEKVTEHYLELLRKEEFVSAQKLLHSRITDWQSEEEFQSLCEKTLDRLDQIEKFRKTFATGLPSSKERIAIFEYYITGSEENLIARFELEKEFGKYRIRSIEYFIPRTKLNQ